MKINENWQRIIEGLSRLQYQVNILAGGEEVDELIKRINDAIDTVSNALEDSKKAINDANKATTEAQEATANANTAVQVVNETVAEATQMLENLETLQAQLKQMKLQLETAATNADTAAINANDAAKIAADLADALNEAIVQSRDAAQRANNAAEVIDGWGTATAWNATVEYVKNNVTTYNGATWQSLTTNINSVPSESNTDWILLAQRGVDGTGSVSKVAGLSPDVDGNVPLIPADIGAETPHGAQEKANGIKEWVQAHGLGTDKPGLIASPDVLLTKTESGFWNVKNTPGSTVLPNDTEDFHVYIGMKAHETSKKIYQTFLAISQKTAKTYTRVITKEGQTDVHIDDSGWVEGGGSGSGVGGGLKFSAVTYDLPTTEESQKSWNLPEKSYVKNNDFIIVFHNGFYLSPTSWNISGDAFNGYVLNIPENPITAIVDNNVRIIIFKNVPTDGTERFSGSLLEDSTVSLEKLGQDVQDAINNAGTKIDIIDNLDSERSDAVLSAKQGNVLKNSADVITHAVVNLEQTVTQNHEEVTAHLAQYATTKDITYYVDSATGSDDNDGLTSTTPFVTISKVTSLIPQIVNHVITINIEAGTYNEDLKVRGKTGGGAIIINGATSLTNTHNLKSVNIEQCPLSVTIQGINTTNTTGNSFTLVRSNSVYIQHCKSNTGFLFADTRASIRNSEGSNSANGGITLIENSTVISENNYGTNNIAGVLVSASMLYAVGATPSGKNAPTEANGGLITSNLINKNQIKLGTGHPEGVVTANVGTLYLRSDGGTNSTLYVKEFGSGNTGWVMK